MRLHQGCSKSSCGLAICMQPEVGASICPPANVPVTTVHACVQLGTQVLRRRYARPRLMCASCQWQRLSKAAAEGGVSKLSSETAEKRQKTFMPPWFRLGTVVHRENLRVHRSGSIRIGCFGFCGTDAKQEEWSKVMLAHKPAAVRRSERLVAALAPPSVPARLVRCAGHC